MSSTYTTALQRASTALRLDNEATRRLVAADPDRLSEIPPRSCSTSGSDGRSRGTGCGASSTTALHPAGSS